MSEAPEMRSEECCSRLDMKRVRDFRRGEINKINFLSLAVMFSQQKNIKTKSNTLHQNARSKPEEIKGL